MKKSIKVAVLVMLVVTVLTSCGTTRKQPLCDYVRENYGGYK